MPPAAGCDEGRAGARPALGTRAHGVLTGKNPNGCNYGPPGPALPGRAAAPGRVGGNWRDWDRTTAIALNGCRWAFRGRVPGVRSPAAEFEFPRASGDPQGSASGPFGKGGAGPCRRRRNWAPGKNAGREVRIVLVFCLFLFPALENALAVDRQGLDPHASENRPQNRQPQASSARSGALRSGFVRHTAGGHDFPMASR